MAIAFNSALTLEDKVRLRLGQDGTKFVPITPEELASELKVDSYKTYQALARLKRSNEIDFEKSDNNRITGIVVHKLEPSGRTYKRAADRAKESIESDSDYVVSEGMTALKSYLDKKLAILEMQETAKQAGLNPEETIRFEENPYAEEGLLLLNIVGNATIKIKELGDKVQMLEFDLEAEKRNVEFLKNKKREETDRGLREFASAPN